MMYQPRRVFWVLLALVAVLSPSSLWAQGNFVYTNDDQRPEFASTVSAFSVAPDGTLTPVAGSPFPTGGIGSGGGFIASNRIGVAIAGKFLFASNARSNDVSVFTINPVSGLLTPVSGSPFQTGGTGIDGIAISATPDGRLLMAANSGSPSHSITVFSIGVNGTLTPIAGSPFPTQSKPDGIKVTPNGKFLAVAEPEVRGVEMFSIAPDGALTSLGRFAEGGAGNLAGVDIDCSTSFLYGGEASINTTVDAFNVVPNGSLAPLAGSPFMPGVGSSSNVVLLSPDDKTLFVSNQESNTITVFRVASSGSLSLLSGSPFSMNHPAYGPSGMATSQDGTLLYVASFSGVVSVFSVATDGALMEVAGSPFSTGQSHSLLSLTAYPSKSCVLTVGIEIKPPARSRVPVNPQAKGKIPVAILSTLTLNAVTQVNTKSLRFGHSGNEASLAFCGAGGEDVNDDGLLDLVCHFSTQQTKFVAGDTTAFLKGKTVTGRRIQGSEGIKTVPK